MEFNPHDVEQKLISKRHDLLFRTNAAGELISINEPLEADAQPAPAIYVCFAKGRFLLKHGAGVPEDWIKNLWEILSRVDGTAEVPHTEIEALIRKSALGHADITEIEKGPAFYIPQKPARTTNVIEINQWNRDVLELHFQYTHRHWDRLQPCLAKVIDDKAVAICRTVRRSSFGLECGVDTTLEFRKRGFGAETVAFWASKVWSEGLIPCYSTQWENKASLALAKKLGMIQYATDILVSSKVENGMRITNRYRCD
ncbi:MAG: GNAT family N-acetyltransferase [bacterium]